MEHELAILSPEKTILTYRLAGLGSRVLAHVIDLFIVGAMIWIYMFIFSAIMGQSVTAQGILVFLCLSTLFLYFILQEGYWNGKTVGKHALGLRVRMSDGTPIVFAAALGRNLLRLADFVPGMYFAGLLAMFTTPKSQRIGDLVANTVVVYEKRSIPMFTPAPHVAGIHPLEASVGELRGMTIEEYTALRRFCDRFPELPTTVQNKLVREVWQPIANQRGVHSIPNVHPIYLAEAVVMKYGREHGLL